MSDAQEIHELFSSHGSGFGGEHKYKDHQLAYVNLIGGATVASGQSTLKWSFQDIKKQWLSLARGWISVPITVTSGATNFSAVPVLAVKQSLLSLIDRVRITRVSGEELVNESGIHLSSNLKLLLENNPEYLSAIAAQLQYAKDEPTLDAIGGMQSDATLTNPQTLDATSAILAVAGGAATPASNQPLTKNVNYNVGFMRRRQHMLNNTLNDTATPGYSATSVAFTANIPLQFIHDWFLQMGFPIFNLNIEIEMTFNVAGFGYSPFCYGTQPAGAVEASAGGVVSPYAVSLTTGTQPRLYYHKVKMSSDDEIKAVKLVESGYSKTISYSHHRVKDIAALAADGDQDREVLTDAVNAKRVWVLANTSSALMKSNSWPSPVVTGPLGLRNANIFVRDVRYFDQNLNTLEQQWKALQEQFPQVDGPDAGPLTYAEFVQRYRILCFDISRTKDFIDAEAASVIRVSGSVTADCNLTFIVEEVKKAVYSFDGNGLSMVVHAA